MPEGVNPSAGPSSSPAPTAETTPPANAATTPPTEENAAPSNPVPPGAAGGGVSSAAGDKQQISEAGVAKLIADTSEKAGLGKLKNDGSHDGNVAAANKLYVGLTKLGNKDPAMKTLLTSFLNELAKAGKGHFNWGLKLDGEPLNEAFKKANAFKGVDQQNPQAPTGGTPKQPGANTEGSGDVSSAEPPMNKSADAPQDDPGATQQPGQQQQGQSIDLSKVNVKQFVKDIDKNPSDGIITRTEVEQALRSNKIDAAGKEVLKLLLSQIAPDVSKLGEAEQLEVLLLSAQQQQAAAPANGAQGAAR